MVENRSKITENAPSVEEFSPSLIDWQKYSALTEVMRFEPLAGISALDQHLTRLENSAERLGFIYNRHDVRNRLHMACFPLTSPQFIQLAINYTGQIVIEIMPQQTGPTKTIGCYSIKRALSSDDKRLYHALTPRPFYSEKAFENLNENKADDTVWLAVDSKNYPTETAFGNIFVTHKNELLTPSLSLGLVPGLLRQALLDSHQAKEAKITLKDLQSGFLIGHDLFGLVKAKLLR